MLSLLHAMVQEPPCLSPCAHVPEFLCGLLVDVELLSLRVGMSLTLEDIAKSQCMQQFTLSPAMHESVR